MGDRITFRGRGRGCIVAAGDAVSPVEPRLKLIKGWLTGGTDPADGSVECGEGTSYPLLVTVDQLEEIFYRAKDAVFSGSVTAEYAFTTLSMLVDGAAPASDFHSGTDADVIVHRSFVTGSPAVNISAEKDIWSEDLVAPSLPISTIATSPQVHGLITGLTHYIESFDLPSSDYHVRGDDGTGEYTAVLELAFSGHVAWVDLAASNNPFDPANELWVGIGFHCYTADPTAAIVDAYTLATGDSNEGESGDLTIVLSSGPLTCRLYASQFAFLTSAYSDLTLTVTEWWPYLTIANLPAWDSATGLPVNGGAAG